MNLAALGAFLSGAASVLGAWIAIRAVRRRADAECEKRLAAFREGLGYGRGGARPGGGVGALGGESDRPGRERADDDRNR